jgi:hypothetical protein
VIDAESGTVRAETPLEHAQVQAIRWSADGKTFAKTDHLGYVRLWDSDHVKELRAVRLSQVPTDQGAHWSPDGRVLAWANHCEIVLCGSDGPPRGVLLPGEPFGRLAVTAGGHYRGAAEVQRLIRIVVQKCDGTSETLAPAEFEQRYGWKNDPWKVRLTD